MRSQGISINKCRDRFGIGKGTVSLIMDRYKESGLSLENLKQIEPNKVEEVFYPSDNTRRKKIPLPDYERIYDHLMQNGSKANQFYLWLKYKKENPAGYHYTQFVHYFKEYVAKNHGS